IDSVVTTLSNTCHIHFGRPHVARTLPLNSGNTHRIGNVIDESPRHNIINANQAVTRNVDDDIVELEPIILAQKILRSKGLNVEFIFHQSAHCRRVRQRSLYRKTSTSLRSKRIHTCRPSSRARNLFSHFKSPKSYSVGSNQRTITMIRARLAPPELSTAS